MSSLFNTALGQYFSGSLEGQIVDLPHNRIFRGRIKIQNGVIAEVAAYESKEDQFIIPPLIDAHMHVESTLCTPAQAGAALMAHGVLGCVSDPHEIANVLGIPGIDFMLADAERTAWRLMFGAPSCVPATNSEMETSGAVLDAAAVTKLLALDKIGYLAEVMNFPGVLNGDADLMQKIAAAKRFNKPIDGHAPGLLGDDAVRYAAHGISTDHECFSLTEALHKIRHANQHILIREGSAARNLEALAEVVDLHPEKAMFCTDDLHPDLAMSGSINRHVV
jgi:adenine deaminase